MPTVMSSMRPAALRRGANEKPEVARRERTQPASGNLGQGPQTRDAALGADPPEAFVHQDAVVAVQPHDVGDRPERHQVQQVGDRRQPLASLRLETPGQRRHQVEGNAHACQGLARERRVGQVRVDHRRAAGQIGPRQVMVRHQHVDATRARRVDAAMRGDAVVDRDDQRRRVARSISSTSPAVRP